MDRYREYVQKKYGSPVVKIDYRDTQLRPFGKSGKWDFQGMRLTLQNGKILKQDRWFNPFWSIWLAHYMSRPSCYVCPYANTARCADITLGDLWGIHLYCPQLYAKNAGASLVVCNTPKGKKALLAARVQMQGEELLFEDALRYQGPMRNHIAQNKNREQFMKDVQQLDYVSLCKKYATPPSPKLLFEKYVWGNRQKMFVYRLTHPKKR